MCVHQLRESYGYGTRTMETQGYVRCCVSDGTGMRVCCWYWYEGMFGGTSTRVHFDCIY